METNIHVTIYRQFMFTLKYQECVRSSSLVITTFLTTIHRSLGPERYLLIMLKIYETSRYVDNIEYLIYQIIDVYRELLINPFQHFI